jgi:very-short-patch-repair endonuclease
MGKNDKKIVYDQLMKKSLVYGSRSPQKIHRAKELRKEQTPSEKYLWNNIRANRLDGFHFRRQHVIDEFIVDFYCHQVRLVVEIDGPIHEFQQEYDCERAHILRQHGLHLIRFTDVEVMEDLEGVLGKLRTVCHKLMEEKSLPPST